MGVFRPKRINRLIIRPETADWTPNELSKLRKPNLFDDGPVQELEKVPWKFIYYFHCEDDQCSGHNLSCTDWELGQSWRSWKDKYGVGWEAKFREKYEREMINAKETHFFVGTVHLHPKNWIIVGLFYPPIPKIQSLFD